MSNETNSKNPVIVRFICQKCSVGVGAIEGSAAWCGRGHRMFTQEQLEEMKNGKK